MNAEIWTLTFTAASIAFIHTLFGPDHYLPFIVLSKARRWSVLKTISITLGCGIGHVASSIAIGAIGIIFGVGLKKLEFIESIRGDWAAWALFIFGVLFLLWGLYKARKNKPHKHIHEHHGTVHIHQHDHKKVVKPIEEHAQKVGHHHHHTKKKTVKLTPWVLFLIFVLGPCEPLIPLLMFPAAKSSTIGLIVVSATFATITIVTMTTIVLMFHYGFKTLNLGKLEKYSAAIAGAIIAMSAAGILFLGL